jgi:hypothetical protein
MNTAFQAAEKTMHIPRMLEVDDVLNGNLDNDSIVTYISSFNLKLEVCGRDRERYRKGEKSRAKRRRKEGTQ